MANKSKRLRFLALDRSSIRIVELKAPWKSSIKGAAYDSILQIESTAGRDRLRLAVLAEG